MLELLRKMFPLTSPTSTLCHPAAGDDSECFVELGRDTKCFREVVERAERQDTQRLPRSDEALSDGGNGAVAATRDDDWRIT